MIERIGKRALPTAAGLDFMQSAHRLREQAETSIVRVRQYGQGTKGRIRIGTGPTACAFLLPRVLKALRHARSELEVRVITGNTSEILDAVEANTIDLALVTLPASRRVLVVRDLFEDPLVAVLPLSDMPLSRSIRPEQMTNRSLILYEPAGTIRSLIDAWFSRAGVEAKVAMEVGSVETTNS